MMGGRSSLFLADNNPAKPNPESSSALTTLGKIIAAAIASVDKRFI
jgi:hypothetical protein